MMHQCEGMWQKQTCVQKSRCLTAFGQKYCIYNFFSAIRYASSRPFLHLVGHSLPHTSKYSAHKRYLRHWFLSWFRLYPCWHSLHMAGTPVQERQLLMVQLSHSVPPQFPVHMHLATPSWITQEPLFSQVRLHAASDKKVWQEEKHSDNHKHTAFVKCLDSCPFIE